MGRVLAHNPVLTQHIGVVPGRGAKCLIDVLGGDAVWTGGTILGLCIKFILHFLQFILQNAHSLLKLFAFFHCISHSKMLKSLVQRHTLQMNKMTSDVQYYPLINYHDTISSYCDHNMSFSLIKMITVFIIV